jgi:hypothetical protein
MYVSERTRVQVGKEGIVPKEKQATRLSSFSWPAEAGLAQMRRPWFALKKQKGLWTGAMEAARRGLR